MSASYLNFTDLVDCSVLSDKAASMQDAFAEQGLSVQCAMNADINGISQGAQNVFIENGIDFLYTNIHTHHGMYPLYQNRQAYYWENKAGQRLLVFSGEHYNLGNAMGIKANEFLHPMIDEQFGYPPAGEDPVVSLAHNVDLLLKRYNDHAYPYDYIILSVSGIFYDNAPPTLEVLNMIEGFNRQSSKVRMELASLETIKQVVLERSGKIPCYRGDMTDWWAGGVGSAHLSLKHYKEAQRKFHIDRQLLELLDEKKPPLMEEAADALLLYAEHTFGHSSTITNPYDSMVNNLDIRKIAYASNAYEAAERVFQELSAKHLGNTLLCYGASGQIKAVNSTARTLRTVVNFYVEITERNHIELYNNRTHEAIRAQISRNPRGLLISFVDEFAPHEIKTYHYALSEQAEAKLYTGVAHMGEERVRDIVNDYDPLHYRLPYEMENDYFHICYEPGKGITRFYNKSEKRELLADELPPFFTPIYENTEIRTDVYQERRQLGRNIRGLHARRYQAELIDVSVLTTGPVFNSVELHFCLEGTIHSSVVLSLYHELPRLEFSYKVGKTLSPAIESLYLPLALPMQDQELWFNKGGVAMRPGIDQLPGSGMEFYISDSGLLYQGSQGGLWISSLDTALLYMGELKHHAIRLCDGDAANNRRAVYSWIMNNLWETNFKMDLSGFAEYRYVMEQSSCLHAEESLLDMEASSLGISCFHYSDH